MKRLGKAANQGVPLVAVRTADQPATVRAISGGFGKAGWGVVSWDCARGLQSIIDGDAAVGAICRDDGPPPEAIEAPDVVSLSAPERTVILILNAQRHLDARLAQALLNARDPYAGSNRMVVLVGPSFEIPTELGSDVYIVDNALPDAEARGGIVDAVAKSAHVELSDAARSELVGTLRGLSPFAASQVVSLASTPGERIDLGESRSQWIETINAVPGLSVDMSGYTLNDVAGLESYKGFARRVAAGLNPPDTIVRVDEIDKAMGGVAGDSSGVSQAILAALLTWMEEKRATGIIAVGPSGAGKSLCSVATGAACAAPTLSFDLEALKASLVGQSGERTRAALKTLEAFAGRTFWIATCNSLAVLPLELRRRFKLGLWFFDLPTPAEADALFSMYTTRYGVEDIRPATYAGWSGAEIRNVCELARDLRMTPREASQYIVPGAVSAADAVEALRRSAHGKYLSASQPGAYVYPGPLVAGPEPITTNTAERRIGGFNG
jgi:hypothetical protein